jgi:hypothetical protein
MTGHTTDRDDPRLKRVGPTGQQDAYLVLSDEERAKGFVRPYRDSYVHVGAPGPKYPLRDLTEEEKERLKGSGYAKYEPYPESESPVLGSYWTQERLDAVGKGCGTLTKMSREISETYARDPKFYGGTFCIGCRKHLPLAEFRWAGTDETVGS